MTDEELTERLVTNEYEINMDYQNDTTININLSTNSSIQSEIQSFTPISILRSENRDSSEKKFKKSVSWSDLDHGHPLTSTMLIPGSGTIDRTSIQTKYSRRRRDRKLKQDRMMVLCCGSIICGVIILASILAFVMLFIFGGGFQVVE